MSQMIFYDNPDLDALSGGETVKYFRRMKGLTQQELADIANVSKKTIANIEAGKSKIDIDTMLRIASRLGIPAPLVFREESHAYCIICLYEGKSKIESYNSLSGAGLIPFFCATEIEANKAYCMKTKRGAFLCLETDTENPERAVCADKEGYLYICVYSDGVYTKECDGQVLEISEVVAEVLGDIRNFGAVN